MNLLEHVLQKCRNLGPTKAAGYFGVTTGTILNWTHGRSYPSLLAGQKVMDEYASFHPTEVDLAMGKKAIVLLPIYRGLSGKTHYTLFGNYSHFGRDKVAELPEFGTLIHESRNRLFSRARKTDAEWYIPVDDDMILPMGNGDVLRGLGAEIPEPNASLYALDRLMSHGPEYKVVAGLYFSRKGTGKAQCHSGMEYPLENQKLRLIREKGGLDYPLREEKYVGLGWARIHRTVIEDVEKLIDEKYPHLRPTREGGHYGYVMPSNADCGEDVFLCNLISRAGHKIWLDPALMLGHEGTKVF